MRRICIKSLTFWGNLQNDEDQRPRSAGRRLNQKVAGICLSDIGVSGYFSSNMIPDAELLRRYAAGRSEEAFAEIVRRYVNLVYSAALRQVNGDAHLAEDVAQTVFVDLARQAGSASRIRVLAGWLYTAANFAAAKAVRAERRRRRHEQDVRLMNETLMPPDSEMDWTRVRPVLDQAMQGLRPAERDLILMRYFENRRLATIAETLGVSEDTARKRAERALEKLRAALSKRGLATGGALASVLAANAVSPAPAHLAGTITSGSHAGATAATGSAWSKAVATKTQAVILAGICVAAVVPLLFQQRRLADLRQTNSALHAQAAQTPEPATIVAPTRPAPTASSIPDAEFARLLKLRGQAGLQSDEIKKLRAELAADQSSAEARAYAVSNYFPRSSWAAAGYATPAAAIQSYNWVIGQATTRGDTNALRALFPSGWARMMQDTGGDEEKISAGLRQEAASFTNTDGIRLVNERPTSNDEVDVAFMLFTNHGTNDGFGSMRLRPVGGQWQLVEPIPSAPPL